jgi:hypothetical protein
VAATLKTCGNLRGPEVVKVAKKTILVASVLIAIGAFSSFTPIGSAEINCVPEGTSNFCAWANIGQLGGTCAGGVCTHTQSWKGGGWAPAGTMASVPVHIRTSGVDDGQWDDLCALTAGVNTQCQTSSHAYTVTCDDGPPGSVTSPTPLVEARSKMDQWVTGVNLVPFTEWALRMCLH